MFETYESLPDYMEVTELCEYFHNFLNQVNSEQYNLVEALEALLELSDRQWHTYEILDTCVKNKVEGWLISVLDLDAEDYVEYATSIIGRLGLVELHKILKDSLKTNLNKEVRDIIEETVNELNGHVEDPYYGMK